MFLIRIIKVYLFAILFADLIQTPSPIFKIIFLLINVFLDSNYFLIQREILHFLLVIIINYILFILIKIYNAISLIIIFANLF